MGGAHGMAKVAGGLAATGLGELLTVVDPAAGVQTVGLLGIVAGLATIAVGTYQKIVAIREPSALKQCKILQAELAEERLERAQDRAVIREHTEAIHALQRENLSLRTLNDLLTIDRSHASRESARLFAWAQRTALEQQRRDLRESPPPGPVVPAPEPALPALLADPGPAPRPGPVPDAAAPPADGGPPPAPCAGG